MNKSELIKKISDRSGITKDSTNIVLNFFILIVIEALKKGEQVILPGFGSFYTIFRSERFGRNPQTGEVIKINATRIAKFRAGKKTKQSIQEQ